MLSFKHHLAAAFVVGSLLSGNFICAETKQEQKKSLLQQYENEIRWGVAAGVGLVVWKCATHQALKDVDGKDIVLTGLKGLAHKAFAAAHPYVLALPRFADHNKHAIQATTAAVLLARYGTRALNSLSDGLKFHNMKQNFPNAWLNVPSEEKAAKAA